MTTRTTTYSNGTARKTSTTTGTASVTHSSMALGQLEAERDQLRRQLAAVNEESRVRLLMLRRLLCDERPIEEGWLTLFIEYAKNNGVLDGGRRTVSVSQKNELVVGWDLTPSVLEAQLQCRVAADRKK